MDGRKTEAIIVQMQLVSVCGLPICVNVQLFFTSGRTTQGNCLTIVFYEYGELNIEYIEK